MVNFCDIPGKEYVVSNSSTLNKARLYRINEVRESNLKPFCSNFSNALVDGITTRYGPIITNLGRVRDLRDKCNQCGIRFFQ